MVKEILAMPPPKKADNKQQIVQAVEEPAKPAAKPQPAPEPKEEDRIDFVNVKDMIKGMEKNKNLEPKDYNRETNGFHKKITDNGHDKCDDTDSEKTEYVSEKTEKTAEVAEKTERFVENHERSLEKTESSDSSESLSRSNSLINGTPVQAPKPLPRSSISEPGAGEELHEAPKPKPRTTNVAVSSGYKVTVEV